MKYVDEFRNLKLIERLSKKIQEETRGRPVKIMEVCGTHTHNFFRFGLNKLIPLSLKLISGPGCPVCVSPQEYIDRGVAYAADKKNIVLSFGDMLRVPGTGSTLERQRAAGADVRMLYSPYEAIRVAEENPRKRVIFLAVGFETTVPAVALTILAAEKKRLKNIFFLSSLKRIPPAMDHLLRDERVSLDAFLCPGHVSVVIGSGAYAAIAKKYKIPCCVAGFEPVDILEGVYLLARRIFSGSCAVDNQYRRLVTPSGNRRAQEIIKQVFSPCASSWRGLGEIPESGFFMKKKFWHFAAEKSLPLHITHYTLHITQKCRCADVLKGVLSPDGCGLFAKACTPDNPYGPCMVSLEGTCHAYYKFRLNR